MIVYFAAPIPAKDGVRWRQGNPHRGGQRLHRREHCHIEGGDRPAPREFLAKAPRRENQQVSRSIESLCFIVTIFMTNLQEGLFRHDAAVLPDRGHGQAGETHFSDVRRQQRRQDRLQVSW